MDIYEESMTGGAELSGQTDTKTLFENISIGGVLTNSGCVVYAIYLETLQGEGLQAEPNAQIDSTFNLEISSFGLQASGESFIVAGVITQGGASVSGDSSIVGSQSEFTLGGVSASGNPLVVVEYRYDLQGEGLQAGASAKIESDFNPTVSSFGLQASGEFFVVSGVIAQGGVSVSGDSLIAGSQSESISGGAVPSGGSLTFVNYTSAPQGGLQILGDNAQIESTFNLIVSSFGLQASGESFVVSGVITQGGLFASGSSLIAESQAEPISGGVFASGGSLVFAEYNYVSQRGLQAGANAQIESTFNPTVSSFGLQASGESFVISGIITQGGFVASGSSLIVVNYISVSQGGLQAGASSQFEFTFNFIVSSIGLQASGESFVQIVWIPDGGISLSGEFFDFIGFTPLGGVDVSGSSFTTSAVNEPVNGLSSGGCLLGGENNYTFKRVKFVDAEGEVIIESGTEYYINDVKFSGKGGVSLTSNSITSLYFIKNFDSIWKINARITRSLSAVWNLGQLVVYWYRVVGKPNNDPCLPQEDCCQTVVLNVHARSLSELCEKLSERRIKFPIKTIQRFNRPAETAIVLQGEENGINYNCNNLTSVDFCNIPQCSDYCVEQDIKQFFGFSIKVQFDAFKSHEADGSLFTGGAASYSLDGEFPVYSFSSLGEIIFVEGESSYYPNHFQGRGGATLGGFASSAYSRWAYTGGDYPYFTPNLLANKVESKKTQPSNKSWISPERVVEDNNQYTISDLSFASTSDILLVNNFNINLPDNISILNVFVYIDRFATKTGVRDLEVYLVSNGQIITDNRAFTATDWPLLETTRIYGLSGWRSPTSSFEDVNFDVEEILNKDFGVHLRIRSVTNINAVIARVDCIKLQIVYQDKTNGKIMVSSNSGGTAKSTGYTSISSGRILLGSQSIISLKRKLDFKPFGGILVKGQSLRPINNFSFIEMHCGGESVVKPYFEASRIPISLSGEAFVTPYLEPMQGGISLSGKSDRSGSYGFVASGEIEISGLAFTPEERISYVTDGQISILGEAGIKKQNWAFSPEGSLFVLGQAEYKGGSIRLTNELFIFDMQVLETSIDFLNDVHLGDAIGNVVTVNKCDCVDLSPVVYVSHNFAKDNIFAKFLVRNNLTISRNLILNYNEINDSWQHNLHYAGLSDDSVTMEYWDVVTELQCTLNTGGIQLGTSIFKLSFQFFRKNLNKQLYSDSRIIISILPDSICNGIISSLNYRIEFDTLLKIAVVSPNSIIYQSSIFDDIGLFKSRAWIEDPNLILSVSQSPAPPTQRRLDITEPVLI